MQKKMNSIRPYQRYRIAFLFSAKIYLNVFYIKEVHMTPLKHFIIAAKVGLDIL